DEQWGLYQRGMRARITDLMVRLVTRRLPVPRGAREMLDLGGSHGYWSVKICRRYPNLRATVLDLPAAIQHAAPLLAREGMGDRVAHRAGDALTVEFGTASYDIVFMAALAHHFDAATNQALMRRVAHALRPGGIVAVLEHLGQDRSGKINQYGGLLGLY